ncbi:MAG: methanogenesis marker 3 protein [Candidatus Methylarchaceae archaeon HK02M1]|nr:methanogenesis marker 3 protein [Candidatus Methylarchaceae archaeon HK02M1]
MDEELSVQVDGMEVLVPKGSSIEEALNTAGVEEVGSFVAVIEVKPEEMVQKVRQYEIVSSRGSLYVELDGRVLDFAREAFSSIQKLSNIWSNPRSISFGYIPLKFKPSKLLLDYDKGDVSIGFLGFEQDKGCIIFMRDKHKAFYGSSSDAPVLGKVVRGRNILSLLDKDDYIKEIKPVTYELPIKRAEMEHRIVNPLKIFTHLSLILSEGSPIGSELVLALFQKKKYLEASDSTSIYIKDSSYSGVSIPSPDKLQERRKKIVTVRVKGEDRSSIYIYKKTVFPSRHHLYVGDVIFGMELVEVAKIGDKIPINISPKRLNVLGMNQKEAEIFLSGPGIKQVREGIVDNEAIVVEQNPYYTLESYKKGVVKTSGIKSKDIVKIEFFDKADPITVKYFRMCTGLLYDKIGRLTVHFLTPDFIIFKEKCDLEKLLIPMKFPKDLVNAYEIGVSNMSSKFMGLIGARLMSSDKYGPTGEKFEMTNIVGKALDLRGLLKVREEGDIIYIGEAS